MQQQSRDFNSRGIRETEELTHGQRMARMSSAERREMIANWGADDDKPQQQNGTDERGNY